MKVWHRPSDGALQWREDATAVAMDGPPPGGVAVAEFDETTNPAVAADIPLNPGLYAVTAGGVLQKSGTTVTLAADGDGQTLRRAAANAISGNLTYLGLVSPTNAQVVAQVAALTRQNDQIIKAVVKLLGG